MITVKKDVLKEQKKFWSNCLFHPTDAVEDAWGRKIIDRMAKDKAVETIRIYTMFEDIVYEDEDGNLAYDFRLNDLRLDYLLENGFNILLAYGMMPPCIASIKDANTCVSKNKTRYKGKLINTSTPTDYKLWEEICYQYTKHIVERYGIETVSKWYIQCFNEPDIGAFFMSNLDVNSPQEERTAIRSGEYIKLYTAFANGILRASDKLHIGGPALAFHAPFLEIFLNHIKENNISLDFISLHNYAGTNPKTLNDGAEFNADDWINKYESYYETIEKCGFDDTEIIVDEWGMSSSGFLNVENCPKLIARETEVYSSYFVKLARKIIDKGWNFTKLMICLSGQHEMVTDFSGFRNFFTLNFFAKPIYNAHILANKLNNLLVEAKTDSENLYVIPTKNKKEEYSVLLTYSSDNFKEDIPEIDEELVFEADIKGKNVVVYCIDKNNNNPYRLYQRMGMGEMDDKSIKILREEGNIKTLSEFVAEDKITLKLTPNCTYLVEVK